MLSDAIKAIVELGQSAKAMGFHTSTDLPDKVAVRLGDKIELVDKPPPRRNHQLLGMDDLVDFALGNGPTQPTIFVGESEVVLVLDETDRRDFARVKLEWSSRWARLVSLSTRPESFEPRDAVKLLRFDLHGGNVEHVLAALRRLNFSRTSAGASSIEHGRESLGRSVEASVQQAETVPESFDFTVAPVTNPGFDAFAGKVKCGVYLDTDAGKVEIRVLPDEIKRVLGVMRESFAAELRERLKGGTVPVLLGTP